MSLAVTGIMLWLAIFAGVVAGVTAGVVQHNDRATCVIYPRPAPSPVGPQR